MKKKNFIEIFELFERGWKAYQISCFLKECGKSISESTVRRRIREKYGDVVYEKKSNIRRNTYQNIYEGNSENSYKYKVGRQYEDFDEIKKSFYVKNVEVDCLVGLEDDKKVIITIYFPESSIQLGVLADKSGSDTYVVDAFDEIEKTIGPSEFQRLFPIMLVDNGREFENFEEIENSFYYSGEKRTYLFFCKPCKCEPRARSERNHRNVREIIPHDVSLDDLTQEQVNHIFNIINNKYRKKLDGKRPVQLMHLHNFDELFIDFFGIRYMNAREIDFRESIFLKKSRRKE